MNQDSRLVQYFDLLANAKGSNAKKEILEKAKGTPLEGAIKAVLVAAYEPRINYYTKEFPKLESSPLMDGDPINIEQAFSVLDQLSSRTVSGNAARVLLSETELALGEAGRLFRRIVERDLKIGMTGNTANKIWPGLIYDHPYMRCSAFNEKNLKKIRFPAFSQTKEDGLYMDIIVSHQGEIEYRTRNGGYINLPLVNLDKAFSLYPGMVFMGEAIVYKEDFSGVEDRKTGNGYLNSDDIDPARIKLVLWDAVPLEDWSKRRCDIPYYERFERLSEMLETMQSINIKLIDSKVVNSVEEVIEHFKENVLLHGLEGTVLKNFSTPWIDGDSPDQVKIKIEFVCELRVVGKEPGRKGSKNENRLGALPCESSDGILAVSVGGGFKDKEREEFWKSDSIVGKIIGVKSNDIIFNRNDPEKFSLFLPRFDGIRFDKNEADSIDQVRAARETAVNAISAIQAS